MNELDKYNEVSLENMDLILDEINEFLHLYLFKGNVILNDKSISNLFNLSNDDLTTLKVVHFFLSDEVKDLIHILPKLIRNLSHSTKKEFEISKGYIKGIIDWNQTFKTRLSKNFDDKSLFVCKPSSKYYDLEENQLFKFILKKMVYFKKTYLNFIPNDLNIDNLDNSKDWYEIVKINYDKCRKVLKKVYFNEISDVKIKSKHIRKCFKSKNYLYHKIGEVYKLYENLFLTNDIEVLKALIEKRVIKSMNANKLYEIYVLFNIIKMLPKKDNLKLLHVSNDYSICCFDENLKITVHYQKTPKVLKDVSKYLKILDNYEFRGSSRLPDIIIEFEKNDETFYRLIEVKNSSDTKYISKSIYKSIAYFKDFEYVSQIENVNFTKKYPVVLITWGGISIKKDYDPFKEKIIILNREEFIANLKQLISL